jgi:hypothetical protein
MARAPAEHVDLNRVKRWLWKYGITTQRFTRGEMAASKTPDFRLLRDGEPVAYCEVKSPRDEWLDDQLAEAGPWVIVGGVREDPVANRVERNIRKAVEQFDAVNPDRRLPNILVFVNHDDSSSFGDLREVLTGHFFSGDGRRYPTMLHISEGRLAAVKRRADAYIWMDGRTGTVEGFFFGEADVAHRDALCEWFGVDQTLIER